MKKLLTIFAFLSIAAAPAMPCTTFCLRTKNKVLVGHNYDYDTGVGMLMVNKRGVAKVSTTEDDGNPAKWTSKYGSVTFNQFGRENPNGGMNEKGLVVELMWLSDTEYPKTGKEPTVDLLEWIQYQLDTAATVAESLQNAKSIRIDPQLPGIKIHYLIADAAGNAAVVEYLGGKLVVRTGADLPKPVLTNNTYDSSLDYTKKTPVEKAASDGSWDRFLRASHKLDEYAGSKADPVSYAFSTLENVQAVRYTSDDYTVWSVVYDLTSREIHVKTRAVPMEKVVDTRKFDYGCGSVAKMLDVDTKATGDVTAQFSNYTRKANRDLIGAAFKGSTLLQFVPPALMDAAAAYPEEFRCTTR